MLHEPEKTGIDLPKVDIRSRIHKKSHMLKKPGLQDSNMLHEPEKTGIDLPKVDIRSRIHKQSHMLKKPGSSYSAVKIDAEGIDVSKYATKALEMYFDDVGVEFELVKIGFLRVAKTSTSEIFHMNFEAKRKNDPQARVQTFFAELIKAGSADVVAYACHRFGRTDSLTGKGLTRCCLYCSDDPILHPQDGGYRNGLSRRVNDIFIRQMMYMLTREAEDKFGVPISDTEKKEYSGLLEALNMFCKEECVNLELVKTGCFKGVAMATGSGKIWHMNFDAKIKDDQYAPVETFFVELTKTDNNDAIVVDCCFPVGSFDSLPDEALIDCCLYCCDDPILHPRHWDYRNGREGQRVSDVLKNQVIFKLKNEAEDGNHGSSDSERLEIKSGSRPLNVLYATVALKAYNDKMGTNFELVRTCCKGAVQLQMGCLVHLNFEAKNKNDHDAQFQIFFTEVIRRYIDDISVDYCYCLGDTDSILDDADDCYFCSYCKGGVHHPPGFGYLYLTGLETWDWDST